jgi:GntR family transcriptional repressor for pyruvate dehydrogenase complex
MPPHRFGSPGPDGSTAAGRAIAGFDSFGEGGRLSDRVAAALLGEIANGAYEPGQRLPPEREMATRFGVSRTVVREAMKALTSRGVVVVRPGSGVFVAHAQATAATESLRLLVLGTSELSYEQVCEVRESLEGQVAALAAERATDEDLDRLLEALADIDGAISGEDYARADGAFHVVIADLAHNRLFRIMLEAVGDVMVELRRRVAYSSSARARVTADHHAIAESILRRDAAEARRLMAEHLAHSRDIAIELDQSNDRAMRQARRTREAAKAISR